MHEPISKKLKDQPFQFLTGLFIFQYIQIVKKKLTCKVQYAYVSYNKGYLLRL